MANSHYQPTKISNFVWNSCQWNCVIVSFDAQLMRSSIALQAALSSNQFELRIRIDNTFDSCALNFWWILCVVKSCILSFHFKFAHATHHSGQNRDNIVIYGIHWMKNRKIVRQFSDKTLDQVPFTLSSLSSVLCHHSSTIAEMKYNWTGEFCLHRFIIIKMTIFFFGFHLIWIEFCDMPRSDSTIKRTNKIDEAVWQPTEKKHSHAFHFSINGWVY